MPCEGGGPGSHARAPTLRAHPHHWPVDPRRRERCLRVRRRGRTRPLGVLPGGPGRRNRGRGCSRDRRRHDDGRAAGRRRPRGERPHRRAGAARGRAAAGCQRPAGDGAGGRAEVLRADRQRPLRGRLPAAGARCAGAHRHRRLRRAAPRHLGGSDDHRAALGDRAAPGPQRGRPGSEPGLRDGVLRRRAGPDLRAHAAAAQLGAGLDPGPDLRRAGGAREPRPPLRRRAHPRRHLRPQRRAAGREGRAGGDRHLARPDRHPRRGPRGLDVRREAGPRRAGGAQPGLPGRAVVLLHPHRAARPQHVAGADRRVRAAGRAGHPGAPRDDPALPPGRDGGAHHRLHGRGQPRGAGRARVAGLPPRRRDRPRRRGGDLRIDAGGRARRAADGHRAQRLDRAPAGRTPARARPRRVPDHRSARAAAGGGDAGRRGRRDHRDGSAHQPAAGGGVVPPLQPQRLRGRDQRGGVGRLPRRTSSARSSIG